MKFFSHANFKRITNGAMIALALGTIAFLFVSMESIYSAFIAEKYTDRKQAVDWICDEIEFCGLAGKHDGSLVRVVGDVDGTVGTYAEVFDENLKSMSVRTPLVENAPFNPLDYPEVVDMIHAHKHGETEVWFNAPARHKLLLYFRWVGCDLVVLGVSKYSVDANINGQLGIWAMSLFVLASVACALSCATFFAGKRRPAK